MKIELIDQASAEEIASLAVCLTNEISERTGIEQFNMDLEQIKKLCANFIESGQYRVLAAKEANRIIGFGALCESRSLYAEGAFGILQEFYVVPEQRSKKVGEKLIAAIVQYAKERDWKRLELCTPPMPEFERTVSFYQQQGFEITGGYKMKYLLQH